MQSNVNKYQFSVYVILLLFFGQVPEIRAQFNPCDQFPPAGFDFHQSIGFVEIQIAGFEGTQTIFLSGITDIDRSDPAWGGDQITYANAIQTEIEMMEMYGTSSFGPAYVSLNNGIPSTGTIEGRSQENDYPADSFFDVFIEIHLAGMILHNQDPMRLSAEIYCIPPIGTVYRHVGEVQLYNEQDQPIAVIIQAVHKLESPLFSVVPDGNLDLATLGPFEFTHRDFPGGAIVEPPFSWWFGWPPMGVIYPTLLNLNPDNDNLDALSFGQDDVVADISTDIFIVTFSVDANSSGLPGTDVNFETVTGTSYGFNDVSAPPEQAADIFFSPTNGMNFHLLDEKDPSPWGFPNMTVTNNIATASSWFRAGNPTGWPGGNNPEDIDAIEMSNKFLIGSDLDSDNMLDELNGNVFFSLDGISVSVGNSVTDYRPGPVDGVASPDDIFITIPPGGDFGIFASGVIDIGLVPGDVLDGLCLDDRDMDGYLDPGEDAAVFTLAPGSPSLTGSRSPADLFYTDFTGVFSLLVTAGEIGLLSDDNIDAIDCQILTGHLDVNDDFVLALPEQYHLYQNHPNPFNATTVINYDIPMDGYVSITIYDIRGREIRQLVGGYKHAGVNSEIWDSMDDAGNEVGAGVYVYHIQTGSFSQTRKMVLLK